MQKTSFKQTAALSRQKGVMLLEALIGILIFSIGILALIAMQSVAVTQVRDAHYRTDAAILAEQMLGNLTLITSSNPPVSPLGAITLWQSSVAALLPSGSGTVTTAANPALGTKVTNVTITVTWRAPGASSDSNHVTVATLAYN